MPFEELGGPAVGSTQFTVPAVSVRCLLILFQVVLVQCAKGEQHVCIVGIDFQGLEVGPFRFLILSFLILNQPKGLVRIRIGRGMGNGQVRGFQRLVQVREDFQLHVALQDIGVAERGSQGNGLVQPGQGLFRVLAGLQ